MDHFKRLTLKNFLCYEYGVFDFHPGVNMIIGPTDHGKSAAMDAFYKLMYNRPMGDDFQSWWGGPCHIGLTVGNAIIRYIKDKTARYEIRNISTGKVTPFDAVGRTVPDQITQLLQMDRKINVQKQLEKKAPIFLLSESPGDVAKHLNEVANLQGIDTALALGKADLGTDEKAKKKLEADCEAKTSELKQYDNLDELKILVTRAEKLQASITRDEKEIDKLNSMLREVVRVNTKLIDLREKLKPFPLIKKAMKDFTRWHKADLQIVEIQGILDEIAKLEDRGQYVEKKLLAKPLIKRGIALLKIIDQYEDDIGILEKDLTGIKVLKTERQGVKKMITKNKAEYKRKFPDQCPLCNSQVNKEVL